MNRLPEPTTDRRFFERVWTMAFAQVYECSHCGDVWQVKIVEYIDSEHDEVFHEPVCSCGRSVREKRIDGKPVWHPLTEEELIDETTDWGDQVLLDQQIGLIQLHSSTDPASRSTRSTFAQI